MKFEKLVPQYKDVDDLKLQGMTEDMRVFVNNVKNTWREEGKSWLKQLPSCIERLCAIWSLNDIVPVNNMSYNYVARAIQHNKNPVVLKVSCDKKLIEDESRALQHFDGAGSIKLLSIDTQNNALLLEQAIPGRALSSVLSKNVEEAMRIYAGVVTKIASKPLLENNYLHVSEWCKAIDRIKVGDVDNGLIKKAIKIRDHLLSSAKSEYLCHGDLHLENIIQQDKAWLSIDPKGVIGEMSFEASAFNFVKKDEWDSCDEIGSVVMNRVNTLANFLKIAADRLLAWVFLREMVSAQWFIEDRGDPEKALKLASSIFTEI